MDQWDISPCTSVCTATGRPLEENEEICAVLFEEGESFVRKDFSIESWKGPPEGAYCFFRTHVPVKQKKRRLLVDDEVLINLFCRLSEETQESRIHFRFVLALILMRKRLLKYEDCERLEGGELWQMRLTRDQSIHRVLNPQLKDEEIQRVSRELGAILHGDMGEFDDGTIEDGVIADTSGDREPDEPIHE